MAEERPGAGARPASAGDEANADPLTGRPGAHPVGVIVGAASGAAIGALLGAQAGPAGAAAGTLVGAVAGALAGKGAAEYVKPTFPRAGPPHDHNLGVGLGAAGGGAAGAAIGSVVGPVGTVVGGVVGAVAGGLAGEGVAEAIDAGEEDEHWRQAYAGRPYVTPGAPYERYREAYRFGWEARERHPQRRFEDLEEELKREWETGHAGGALAWDEAAPAVRDAWARIDSRDSLGGGRRPVV